MNLRHIIAAIALVLPSFLCMGMEQSQQTYVLSQSAVEKLGEGIFHYQDQQFAPNGHSKVMAKVEQRRDESLGYTEQKLNHLLYKDPNQSFLFIKPSKVLAIVEQRKQLQPVVKRHNRPLYTPSRKTTHSQSQKTYQPRTDVRTKKYNPETIYISNDKEVIEID